MAVNSIFHTSNLTSITSERNLYKDLIKEAIQIYGHDVYYVDIYDDIYLKRYATALIKRQWGANLSKFSGVQLLGGVEMNGGEIYSQAQEELEKLEEQIQLAYELPPEYMMG